MTVLPHQRIQCDRCRSVFMLAAKRSDHWGMELRNANWIARPIGSGYRHACAHCADELLAEFEGRRNRYADQDAEGR